MFRPCRLPAARISSARLDATLLVSLLLILACPGASRAADLQVNSYTSSNQNYPVVGRAANGSFVVVWETRTDGDGYSIAGQRFDSAGGRIGGEFQVNSYTVGWQRLPALAMNASGAFVVAWRSADQDGSDYGIVARRFDSTGAPVGGEIQANDYTTGGQTDPAVTIDQNGGFVVTWATPRDGYGGGNGIFARRFSSTGAPLAPEFRVNSYTLYTQRYPAVASDADGDFVVVWDSRNQDGGAAGSYGVFGQRFDSAGAALATEFQINLYTTTEQFFVDVAAAADGSFVVVWESFPNGPQLDIFARRFASSGAAVGGELQINARTTGDQSRPTVDTDGAGNFIVAWTDAAGRDGNTDGIFARRFDSTGAPLDTDFQVNSYTLDQQRIADVALGSGGGYVVAWQSAQQDGFGFGIFARSTPALAPLDIDGNGTLSPLTDGLLVLRSEFGFTGPTLVNGAVGGGCTRCTDTAIAAYIAGLGNQLDIDGNSTLGALTDGLLVLRYTFGFSGSTLVSGAVGGSCSRCDAAAIEPYLDALKVPPNPI